MLANRVPARRMHLCIVDDSDSFRSYLESLLRLSGYDDIAAYASAEACLDDLARDDTPGVDLILMDLIMAANDTVGEASVTPVSCPVSWTGKNPLGTMIYRATDTATVARAIRSVTPWWSSTTASVRP